MYLTSLYSSHKTCPGKFKEVFKLIVSVTEEETQEVIAQFKE